MKWDTKSPMSMNIDRIISLLIAKEALPLSIVDSINFRQLITAINPRYQLVFVLSLSGTFFYRVRSRTVFSDNILPSLLAEAKAIIKKELKNAVLSLTLDGWTSKDCKKSLMAVTGKSCCFI